MAREKGSLVGSLGDYLKEQRLNAKLSLRQLSEIAGVSNPYLSQIERGLRKPSADVLQQLAQALRISSETLYVQAGILHPSDHIGTSVEIAILNETRLTERQRRTLLDVYRSFLEMNEVEDAVDEDSDQSRSSDTAATGRRTASAKKSTKTTKKSKKKE